MQNQWSKDKFQAEKKSIYINATFVANSVLAHYADQKETNDIVISPEFIIYMYGRRIILFKTAPTRLEDVFDCVLSCRIRVWTRKNVSEPESIGQHTILFFYIVYFIFLFSIVHINTRYNRMIITYSGVFFFPREGFLTVKIKIKKKKNKISLVDLYVYTHKIFTPNTARAFYRQYRSLNFCLFIFGPGVKHAPLSSLHADSRVSS